VNTKIYSCGTLAALLATGCGGEWASENLCPPLGNAVDCNFHDPTDGQDDGPTVVDESPCGQIGAAVGLTLEAAENPRHYPPWAGDIFEAAATMALAPSDGQMPFASWQWEIKPSPDTFAYPGEPASLQAYESELHYATPVHANQWHWVQADHMQAVTLHASDALHDWQIAVPTQAIAQGDGSAIHYAYTATAGPYDEAVGRWEMHGVPFFPARLRGYAQDHASAGTGGPSAQAMQPTISGTHGFRAAQGWCQEVDAAADGGSEGGGSGDGGGTGDSTDTGPDDPPAATFDPCEMLGLGAQVLPAGYSPAWLETDVRLTHRMWITGVGPSAAAFWDLPHPVGDGELARFAGLYPTLQIEPAAGLMAAAWTVLAPFDVDLEPSGASFVSLEVAQDATLMPLSDGSWLAYVEDPPVDGSYWTVDGFTSIRGWAQVDQPGVPVLATGAAPYTNSDGVAWMPSAGYCNYGDGGEAVDESGG
jgi:hypothetical protein